MIPTFRDFLTAGAATFTVTSRKTHQRFTYRVTEVDDSGPEDEERRYFVSVLTGPDNTESGDYTYAGMMRYQTRLGHFKGHQTKGSKIAATAPSWLGFMWLLSRVPSPEALEAQAEVDHIGQCAKCRRPLTVPESIRSGFGPKCRKDLGL